LQRHFESSLGFLKSLKCFSEEASLLACRCTCSLTGHTGHDNGYTTILTQLQTEGLLSKVTLLRGYADIARELQNLNLPIADVQNIFLKQKIVSHPFGLKKVGATVSTPNIKSTVDAERTRAASSQNVFTSPVKAKAKIVTSAADAPDKHLKRLNPRIVSVGVLVH
jgi:hypothetical protein